MSPVQNGRKLMMKRNYGYRYSETKQGQTNTMQNFSDTPLAVLQVWFVDNDIKWFK